MSLLNVPYPYYIPIWEYCQIGIAQMCGFVIETAKSEKSIMSFFIAERSSSVAKKLIDCHAGSADLRLNEYQFADRRLIHHYRSFAECAPKGTPSCDPARGVPNSAK